MAVLSSAMVRRQAKILSGQETAIISKCVFLISILSFDLERNQGDSFPWPLAMWDKERLRPRIHHENSWNTDETIVYNMKPSLHLHNQCFCTTKCRWAFLNPSSLFAIVLKVDNFSKTPSKGHLQRYSDFKTKRIRNHFPFTGRFSFFKTNPPP